MGTISVCLCTNAEENKIPAAGMSTPIILKDDPLLIYYHQNDLNESTQKNLEDLIITSSYKSNIFRNSQSS